MKRDCELFILHWNRPEACIKTVERFLKQGAPVTITVIDNGSRPSARSSLRGALPRGVRYLQLETNLGWGAAFNRVLQSWLATRTAELCFISAHDALPAPACLNRLIDAFAADSRIGIVSPEYGIAHLPIFSPVRGPRLVEVAPRRAEETEYVDFVHGTLMGFRRACLEEIGLFDDRYFAYGDETEISLRANRAGWKTAIVWGAIVTNPETSSPSELAIYLLTRGALLMARDYGGRISGLCRAALVVANTARLLLTGRMANWRRSAPARLRAVGDFLSGRLGKPTRYLRS
jgi:N-acetylglucosaminyl-diphospho-decaprenol L-rhamnosyltransferase